MLLACGNHESYSFEATSGLLTSPYYPSNYVNNLDCTYQISVGESSGGLIVLNFTHVDIESHSSCDYDSVEVSLIEK